MYRILIMILFFLMALGCQTADCPVLPDLGETIYLSASENVFLVLSRSGSLGKVAHIKVDGQLFELGINDNDQVDYISTRDSRFQTPEKLSVGDLINITPDFSLDKVCKEDGWAYYIKLPSGWNAAFTIGSSMTEGDPSGSEKIMWFFKR